ncbi:unnamed protein product [Cercospora beticola]|nr:unnamed protein product [Cercospora beticola]
MNCEARFPTSCYVFTIHIVRRIEVREEGSGRRRTCSLAPPSIDNNNNNRYKNMHIYFLSVNEAIDQSKTNSPTSNPTSSLSAYTSKRFILQSKNVDLRTYYHWSRQA